jgi:enhancing lycopene biosynthesis protein 2
MPAGTEVPMSENHAHDANAEKSIGVLLCGAGFLDGSEIQESVLALLALDQRGVRVRIFAPRLPFDEIDHLSGDGTGRTRDVLAEAARIGRGVVEDIATVNGTDVDGWVIPGGFGVAKSLCDFASKGDRATAHKDVARVVREALAAQLPVGACCIAPALLAVITKGSGRKLKLTIGDDVKTADAITSLGAHHHVCAVDEICVDGDHRVVTAPAFMFGDARISDVAKGIDKMVAQVVAWA